MTAAKKTAAKKAAPRKRTKPTATEAPRPLSLRDAIAAKKTKTAYYEIPLVDSETAERAGRDLAEVSSQLEMARHSRNVAKESVNDDLWEHLQKTYAEAKAARDACFWRVEFRGLPTEDMEALVNEYGRDPDAKDDEDSENDRFIYELVAASYVGDGGLTADEWREELSSDRWSRAERSAFLNKAHEANSQDFSDTIPKG